MRLRDFNQQPVDEGINDPGIFKAVFTAGGPGSGKTTVARLLGLEAAGLKNLSSDNAFAYLLQKHGLDPKMPPEEDEARGPVRDRAKEMAASQEAMYIEGRLGLVIDGTGTKPQKILTMKQALEDLGYQTAMIFVDTDEETAVKRNIERGNRGGRTVPEEHTRDKNRQARAAAQVLDDYFGEWMAWVDNSTIYTKHNEDFRKADKMIRRFLSQPLTSKAQDWIEQQKRERELDTTVGEVTESWHLSERLIQKSRDGKKQWALVSKDDSSKVLKWFGSRKPSEEAVEREERRVQAFKHMKESGPRPINIPSEDEPLSKVQLDALEKYADRLFGKLGIDVEFTRHFRDRINDARNGKQITYSEMISFFNRAFEQHGGDIRQLDPVSQAVLKDLSADINVPFVFKWDTDGPDVFELVTKTIMRKPNFHTPNEVYPINEGIMQRIEESALVQKLIRMLKPVADKIDQIKAGMGFVRKVYISYMLGKPVAQSDLVKAGEEIQDWLRALGLGFVVVFPLTPVGTLAVLVALRKVQKQTGVQIYPRIWDEEVEETRERLKFDADQANYTAGAYAAQLAEFLEK
jgi:predicted ABC-type ATPase